MIRKVKKPVRKRVVKTTPRARAKPKMPLNQKPQGPVWEKPMTTDEYLAALKRLGLTTASQRTARAIGFNVRRCQRFASGDAVIPVPVKRLLNMYLANGLPADVRDES